MALQWCLKFNEAFFRSLTTTFAPTTANREEVGVPVMPVDANDGATQHKAKVHTVNNFMYTADKEIVVERVELCEIDLN